MVGKKSGSFINLKSSYKRITLLSNQIRLIILTFSDLTIENRVPNFSYSLCGQDESLLLTFIWKNYRKNVKNVHIFIRYFKIL